MAENMEVIGYSYEWLKTLKSCGKVVSGLKTLKSLGKVWVSENIEVIG